MRKQCRQRAPSASCRSCPRHTLNCARNTVWAPIHLTRTTTSWRALRICVRCMTSTASPGFLAAYNAGPERYDDHLVTGQPLPAETQLYLSRLEPLIGGVQVARIMAAPDPLAWMDAPLFIRGNANAEISVDQRNDQSCVLCRQSCTSATIHRRRECERHRLGAAVRWPVRAHCSRSNAAMRRIVVPRGMAGNIGRSGAGLRASRKPASRLPDKSTAVGGVHVVGFICVFSAARSRDQGWRYRQKHQSNPR